MKRFFKHANSLILSGCLSLMACGGAGYDPSGDPDNDSNWVLRDAGIDDEFHRIPEGSSLSGQNTPEPICFIIDADGDGTSTDSIKTVITFSSAPNQGQHSIYVYLGDTLCASGQPDYIDQLRFDYLIYTANFYFNRMDGEVTALGRIVNTQAAADLLNQEIACGVETWAVSSDLVSVVQCLGEAQSISGFQQDATITRKNTGEIVKGLYIHVGQYFTYKLGSEGERPSHSEIAEYTGSELSGDRLFVSVN